MQISVPPLNLGASKYLSSTVVFNNYMVHRDTLSIAPIQREFVDSLILQNIEFGAVVTVFVKQDFLPVKDLTKTSSAFTIVLPAIAEEAVTVDTFKLVELSINDYLSADAVPNGVVYSEFNSVIRGMLNDAKDQYMWTTALDLLKSWTPAGTAQTLHIDLIDESAAQGTDLVAIKEINASAIAKAISLKVNNCQLPQTGLTDVASYIDPNGDGVATKPVMSNLRTEDAILVLNDKYKVDMKADSMALLMNQENIKELLPSNIRILPSSCFSDDVVGYYMHVNKAAIVPFFSVGLSMPIDATTTYQKLTIAFAYGSGILKNLPAVKITASVPVTP